jgi:hypothetical protein
MFFYAIDIIKNNFLKKIFFFRMKEKKIYFLVEKKKIIINLFKKKNILSCRKINFFNG